jgi:hypothetical protein
MVDIFDNSGMSTCRPGMDANDMNRVNGNNAMVIPYANGGK